MVEISSRFYIGCTPVHIGLLRIWSHAQAARSSPWGEWPRRRRVIARHGARAAWKAEKVGDLGTDWFLEDGENKRPGVTWRAWVVWFVPSRGRG